MHQVLADQCQCILQEFGKTGLNVTEIDYYQPPSQELHTNNLSTYTPRIFSWRGRIGRVRYMAYSVSGMFILSLSFFLLILVIRLAVSDSISNVSNGFLVLATLLIMLVVQLVLVKRRLNDLDVSGWFSVILFIPFANIVMALLLIVMQGTASSNNYGPMPNQNSKWLVWLGLVLPSVLIGILITAIKFSVR